MVKQKHQPSKIIFKKNGKPRFKPYYSGRIGAIFKVLNFFYKSIKTRDSRFFKYNLKENFGLLVFYKKYSSFYYPIGGSIELLNKMKNLLQKNKVKILLNTNVDSLDFSGNKPLVTINSTNNNKKKKYFDKILVSPGSTEMKIKVDKNHQISAKNIQKTSLHYLVEIKGKLKKQFSYYRIYNLKGVHRVSNVSNFCNPIQNNKSIILVGLDWNSSESIDIEKIKNTIIKLEITESKSNINFVKIINHPYNSTTNIEEITKFNIKELKYIYEPIGKDLNLMQAMKLNIKRWKEKLIKLS